MCHIRTTFHRFRRSLCIVLLIIALVPTITFPLPAQPHHVYHWGEQAGAAFQVNPLSSISAISTGGRHSIALKSNGSVWTWGSNYYGQLGIGTSDVNGHPVPAPVPGLSNSSAVAAGYTHNLALKTDGTVWAWGNNAVGQLGDGTTLDRYSPVRVNGLAQVTAISAGYNYCIALRSDGTLWAWGANGQGQLGDGTTQNRFLPVKVNNLTSVIAVSAGFNHVIALKSNGTVWTWGSNRNGQLGIGIQDNTPHSIPLQINSLNGIVFVEAGGGLYEKHMLAVTSDGQVWAWGSNGEGQLGDGTTTNRTSPVLVTNLTGIAKVSCGSNFSMALSSNGNVWNWGYLIGDVTPSPISASSPSEIVAIEGGDSHFLALRADGSVWAWGGITPTGEVGDRSNSVPTLLPELTDVVTVATGELHHLLLKTDGTVWAWGANTWIGRLGDGTNLDRHTPVQVKNLSNIVAIAAGNKHSLAVNSSGRVYAWGGNSFGQLGIGTADYDPHPYPVQVNGLTQVIAVAVSSGENGFHNLALKSDGTVWAWGKNESGQLGDGTENFRYSPVRVNNLTNIQAIAAGDYFSLALRTDGSVWAWGSNNYGQLGDGTNTYRRSPVVVSGLANVIGIAASNGYGSQHSLAVKSDGTVWAWGGNFAGQLGDGTTSHRNTPFQVPNLSNAEAVAVGSEFSLVLKTDGTVWTWGANYYKQLGDGTNINRAVPVQVNALSGTAALAVSNSHTLALAPMLPVTLSGNLTLEDLAPSAPSQMVEFTLRSLVSEETTTLYASVGPSKTFVVPDAPRGSYMLHIKGTKWLAGNVGVNSTSGDVADVNRMLLAGDANNDNNVDVFDLDVLIQAFDVETSAPHWNPGADFNCDGSVDVFDLDLLIRNFDLTGDP